MVPRKSKRLFDENSPVTTEQYSIQPVKIKINIPSSVRVL